MTQQNCSRGRNLIKLSNTYRCYAFPKNILQQSRISSFYLFHRSLLLSMPLTHSHCAVVTQGHFKWTQLNKFVRFDERKFSPGAEPHTPPPAPAPPPPRRPPWPRSPRCSSCCFLLCSRRLPRPMSQRRPKNTSHFPFPWFHNWRPSIGFYAWHLQLQIRSCHCTATGCFNLACRDPTAAAAAAAEARCWKSICAHQTTPNCLFSSDAWIVFNELNHTRPYAGPTCRRLVGPNGQ